MMKIAHFLILASLFLGCVLCVGASVSPNNVGTLCNPYTSQSTKRTTVHNERHSAKKPTAKSNTNLLPVVFVPGYSGATLDAELNNAQLPSYCDHTESSFRLWLSLYFLDPFRTDHYEDCWYRMMSLNYSDGVYSSASGVTVTPVEYMGSGSGGGTKGCDYILNVDGYGVVSYFGTIMEQLADSMGYQAGATMWGANFDWRVTPDFLEKHTTFVSDFTNLIEKASETNGNKPVILMAHSMGNLIVTRYLNQQSEEWKSKYVAQFISISAPWAGTSKSVRDLLTGDSIIGENWYNELFDVFDRTKVYELAQNYGTITYMLPSYTFWNQFPLVHFNDLNTNYTANQLQDLFTLTGNTAVTQIYPNVKDLIPELAPPNVPIYCLGGVGVQTERYYVYDSYKDTVSQGWPTTYCGDGDGTVAAESLRICQSWKQNKLNGNYTVDYSEYPGRTHVGILTDTQFVNDVVDIIKYINTQYSK